MQEIFNGIYQRNAWRGASVSGPGSSGDACAALIERLPAIFKRLEVKSLLDIPCGDYNWMRRVDLSGVQYIGADIVGELVERTRKQHGGGSAEFMRLDITESDLPACDMVFCRDCLPHFSFADIRRAVANILRSGCRYVAATTFTERKQNSDVVTGGWRPLNMAIDPLCFGEPLEIINENLTGQHADKSIAIWNAEKLKT